MSVKVPESYIFGQPRDVASYIIFIENSIIKAKSGRTGRIEFQGTNTATVINTALNALPAGGGKVVLIEGDYSITESIVVPNSKVVLAGLGKTSKITTATNDICLIRVEDSEQYLSLDADAGNWVSVDEYTIFSNDSGDKKEGTASLKAIVDDVDYLQRTISPAVDWSSHAGMTLWVKADDSLEVYLYLRQGGNEIYWTFYTVAGEWVKYFFDFAHPDGGGSPFDWTAVDMIEFYEIEAADYHFDDWQLVDAIEGVQVRDLFLQTAADGVYGINFQSVDDGSRIENCWFEGCDRSIYILSCDDLTVEGNQLDTSASYGIHATSSNYLRLLKNKILTVTSNEGIYVSESPYVQVVGNHLESCNGGIHIDVSHNGIISENKVVDTTLIGMRFHASENLTIEENIIHTTSVGAGHYGIYAFNTYYSSVIGNTIEDAGDEGIFMDGSSNATVSGNALQNSASHGIHGSACADLSITGNAITLAGENGILVSNVPQCVVVGNTVELSQNDGIQIYSSEYCTVSGNTLHSNSQETTNTWAEIFITNTSTRNSIIGNTCQCLATTKSAYCIRENAVADDYNIVVGNNCLGAVTAQISLQGVNSEEAHNIVA